MIQAFSKSHYLTLGLIGDNRINEEEINDDAIEDLEKLDPLRRAFKLAEFAENSTSEAGQTVSLINSYLRVKEELESFSRGILTTCQNMREVGIILEHTPGAIENEEQPNWETALCDGRVGFVSHPYFQEYFERRMMGRHLAESPHLHPKPSIIGIYLPFSLLLFFCYPFVVFADLFRDADILFERKNKSDNRLFSFFRTQIHTPCFRQNVHVALQGIFLVLLVLMMWNPIEEASTQDHKTDIRILFYIVLAVTAVLFFEEGVDFLITWKEKSRGFVFDSFWNLWTLSTRFLLLVGLIAYLAGEKSLDSEATNRATLSGNHILNWSFTLVSLGVAGEFFKVLRILLLFQTLGPLVICIINCLKDAAKTIAIYFVVFCTFAIFTWGMFKPFHRAFNQPDNATANALKEKYDFGSADAAQSRDSLFHRLLWKILSAGDQTGMQIKYKEGDGSKASHEFSHSFILVIWALYQIVVAIVMINLLIAVMNNTFASVWQTADKKWKYSKSYYQVTF